jgi:hypothetical protein
MDGRSGPDAGDAMDDCQPDATDKRATPTESRAPRDALAAADAIMGLT